MKLATLLALAALVLCAPAQAQTFEEALAASYEHNPGIQARRAQARAADEGVAEAVSAYRPDIEATGGIGASRQTIAGGDPISKKDTLTPRDVGVSVKQPLFRGFRSQSGVESAQAQAKAAHALLRQGEQGLLFETARIYLDVLQSQSIVELTRNNERLLREQLEATQRRFDVGEVTKTDVSQSIARLNGALAARTRAEGALANDRAAFTRLVGAPPTDLKAPAFAPPSFRSAEEAAQLAEKNHPSVLAAQLGHEAAKADITKAEGALLPEVNLVGGVSRSWEQNLSIPNRQDSATIMARMTVPLYKSGADYARSRAARETAVQKRLEIEEARRLARENALQAWQDLASAQAAIEAFESEKKANETALYGVQEESKAGTRTILDVLNAQQELLGAEVNLVRARHDRAIALLRLKEAIGDLSPESLKLAVKSYDPLPHYESARGKWLGLSVEE